MTPGLHHRARTALWPQAIVLYVCLCITALNHMIDAGEVGLILQTKAYVAILRYGMTERRSSSNPGNHGKCVIP